MKTNPTKLAQNLISAFEIQRAHLVSGITKIGEAGRIASILYYGPGKVGICQKAEGPNDEVLIKLDAPHHFLTEGEDHLIYGLNYVEGGGKSGQVVYWRSQ